MLIRYNEFIKENNNTISIDDQRLLKEFKIEKYEYNKSTDRIDVFEDVSLRGKRLIEIPITFGEIDGFFDCSNNELTTLKNGPTKISQHFICSSNLLTSLKYCPEFVGLFNEKYFFDFECEDNLLTSLRYCPTQIKGNFHCYDNKLKNLNFCPKEILGSFTCGSNFFSSIEDYPLTIIHGKISRVFNFEKVLPIIKSNKNIFENLLDDKIKFHQMIM